jgi:hypothetical protein
MVDCYEVNKCYLCPPTFLLPMSPAAQNRRRLFADTGAERLADLPVMTERVDDAAHEPTVLFMHRPHFSCSGS